MHGLVNVELTYDKMAYESIPMKQKIYRSLILFKRK